MCLINQCECYSLDWVFAHDAISFTRNMFMHYYALLFVLFFYPVPYLLLCFSVSFLLSWFSFLLMAPKKSVPCKNPIRCHGSFSSSHLFLTLWGFMLRRPEMTSLRTSLAGQFIQNARSFCLIFQTLLFSMSLALEVGLLYVKYPRGVLVCSYRNSTPIYMPSIPMCLGLLWYSKAHIS